MINEGRFAQRLLLGVSLLRFSGIPLLFLAVVALTLWGPIPYWFASVPLVFLLLGYYVLGSVTRELRNTFSTALRSPASQA